jgi:hypothetical protein
MLCFIPTLNSNLWYGCGTWLAWLLNHANLMVLTVISYGVESVVESGQQLTQIWAQGCCVNHAISSAKFQSVVADYTRISKVLPVFSEFTNCAKMERCRVKVQNLKIWVLFKPSKRHEIMPIQKEKPSCNIYQNSSSPIIAVVQSSGGFRCVQCVRSIRWWRKTTCENVVLEVESMISRLHESLLIPSCDLDALQAHKAPTSHSDPCFVNWWSKL